MFNIGNKEDDLNFELDKRGVNNLRGLCLDMIYEAKSGHSGIILGAANIIYVLFKYHMNIDVNNLDFVNRDRFVFSAGHGSPLLYAIAYFLDLLTIDDLKKLRRLGSKTPGHTEVGTTPLAEFSSGPLGQGVATSVGMALSEAYLSKKTNNLVDYYTYVLCGDGELEEGITYEALALAGTWKLNKLIVILDSNDVSLDGNLNISSHEDIKKRFESINFNIIEVSDDIKSINDGIKSAKNSDLPNLIIVKTKIGMYSKYEGMNKAHGMVPDMEELIAIKKKLDLYDSSFTVNAEVIDDFKKFVLERGIEKVEKFKDGYNKLENKEMINKIINHANTYNLNNFDIQYEDKSLRDLSSEILNLIATDFDLLIGGSADLSSSCKTRLDKFEDFSSDNYLGRNIYFGIREHAMGAIINGIALSGFRPFASTFLVFSDYMKPSIRESAIMNLPVIYIFTHDSFLVGQDGIAHQPIEQLPSLELIPNLKVYRPYDLNELIGCYVDILKHNNPSCLILPRDSNEISNNTKANEIENGIYEVLGNETNDYINIVANGYELGLALKVSDNLRSIGIDSKVFSIPCKKNINVDLKVLFNNKKTIAITLASKDYFYDITENVIGMDGFGLSGNSEELLEYFGYTPEKIQKRILDIINKYLKYYCK